MNLIDELIDKLSHKNYGLEEILLKTKVLTHKLNNNELKVSND